MNKYVKVLACFATMFLINQPTLAGSKSAPEVDISMIKGSIRDFENSIPNLKTAFISSEPQKRKDGLAVGKLPKPSDITTLAAEIAEGSHGIYDSLLIAHKGKLVFESYYHQGRVNLPHPQASATKGYTAFAIGRAIQLGYLSMEDLHKPVLHFLKDIDQSKLAKGIEKITLHHSLSMRSGLRLSDKKHKALSKNPTLIKGQKLAQAYFTHGEPVTKQSQQYRYQGTDPNITMLVLDAVVPGTAKDFIKSELLDKLGITQYVWLDNVSGLPEAGYRTSMTSRDMIKWASLLSHRGKWQGEQLISEAFLKQATGSIATPYSETFDYSKNNFRYGYYFWGADFTVGEKQYDVKLAWGGGSQMTIAFDELDLLVAITARKPVDGKTIKMLEERVLPTFVSTTKENQIAFPKLEGP